MSAQFAAESLGDTSAQLRWHLVFTKPLCEELAKVNLERQGYRVYFPRLQQKVPYRGRWRDRISALFPRYVFVQLNRLHQSLAPLHSTVGVSNVVRFGTEYIPVPNAIVAGLKHCEDATGLHHLAASPLKPGARVRVVDGAMTGFDGIFEREDGADRIVVLFNLLGREVRINLHVENVAPVAI